MKSIFIGYLFIFLKINVEFGNSSIGLPPDFLGYIFIANGLKELSSESPRFAEMRPFAICLGIYSGILYALDLFGTLNPGWIGVLLGIANTLLSLYLAYRIIQGVKELEVLYSSDLNCVKLKSRWLFMAVFQCAAYIALIVPMLGMIAILLSALFSILFTAAFYTAWKLHAAARNKTT